MRNRNALNGANTVELNAENYVNAFNVSGTPTTGDTTPKTNNVY